MKKSQHILFVLFLSLALVSCKTDTKKSSKKEVVKTNVVSEKKVQKTPKVLTEKEKKVISSLFTKIMTAKETKSFASAMVTSELTGILSNQEGPFTVFAPANNAFTSLVKEKKKDLYNAKSRDSLIKLVKTHIVKGDFKLTDLQNGIKENKGKFQLKTLYGSTLVVSEKGDKIIVEDENGNKAVIIESDIVGSNGVLYIVDSLFY